MAAQPSIELTTIGTTSQKFQSQGESTNVSAIPAIDAEDGFDRGYAWVIAGACSVMSMFVGLLYSWGVMQAYLAKKNVAPDSTLAFIGSTAVAGVAVFAVISTHLIRRTGTRNASLISCALMTTAQFLSSWTTENIGGLFVTNGVLLGLGCSIGFMASSGLPAQYFKRRRGLANGLVYAGNGIGACVFSLLSQTLLTRLGIAWTFRILSFITIATTLPAALFMNDRTRRASASFDFSFYFSCRRWFPLLVPPFFIPLYASSIGISGTLGSILLALFSLSSAAGRLGFGYLGDIIGPITSLLLTLVVCSLSMLVIWPVSASIGPFVVFVLINGAGNGGFFATMPSVIGHIYGSKRLATALAMVVSAYSAGYLMGAPVAGFILEQYGGNAAGRAAFRPAMYYAGSMSLGSAAFVLVVRYLSSPKLLAFV
ncbi:major facilitator superfamily domain-containing protein [Hygrophoropsis aurantiaca]|uniref:Major facilitator superfamily domain-containing protein n=1 Tax=Hygrophoropsis aurantiaca TaxID=72124 RepID=A0ACB8AUC7_9AGAM|nr:major facilitator superfamily domain-containing protein [Hygrophoropsis aurantiaca]